MLYAASPAMASIPTSADRPFFVYIRYMYFPLAPLLRSLRIRVYSVGGITELEVLATTRIPVTGRPKLGSVE